MSKINSAIAGAGAGAAMGGIPGAIAGGVGGFVLGEDDKSADIYNQMIEEAKRIPLPTLRQYFPELYQQVVAINPELEQAVTLGPSQMAGIGTDPALRQAQLNALGKLQEIGENGMTASDRAAYARMESDINTNLQGQQGAIMQNLAARGMAGGGSELVARQLATQQAANRQAQLGMDLRAQAEQRALQALIQGGQLAGNMQTQDFQQKSAQAQAADAIAKFNAQNTQAVRGNNVNRTNDFRMHEAQERQRIADANTGVRNDAQQYNNNLPQQNYENELRKRGMINSGHQGLARSSEGQAARQDAFIGGLIDSGAKYYSQRNKKKDEE